MFIAMNRFRVRRGAEERFEDVWRQRDSRLETVPGFVEFRMLRGPAQDDHALHAAHTVWADRATFAAWTNSPAFRDAHRNAGDNSALYPGPPNFEGFEAVDDIRAGLLRPNVRTRSFLPGRPARGILPIIATARFAPHTGRKHPAWPCIRKSSP